MDVNLAELLHAWIGSIGERSENGEQRSSSAELPLAPWYCGQEVGCEAPGGYPYTRGISQRGYLDEFWVMGQYSGYASPQETNQRFKDLLAAGQTGLSIALDLPTQLGLDSDNPLARDEVGKVGVPLDTVEDLLVLLDGLQLERVRQIRTSANAIGPIFVAFIVVALEELGISSKGFRLMLQNDPLKEFPARGTFIFPPKPSLKLAVDVIEYFATYYPHWEPIEFCGYHIRDAGGTAVQEVAIATANGIAYLDAAAARGVDIERLAHSLFLFFSAGLDIFEEAAKLRAARRLWARLLHERYGVQKELAKINTFVYTLGGALVAQEPLNNVIRVAYEALAAVLGGVQTLATSSYDEALGLPSKSAAHLALRTQQVLAYETGVAKVADPLGGSYYVETLTNGLDTEICSYLLKITELGGAVAALEAGFINGALSESAYQLHRQVESGERPVIGVNIHKARVESISETFAVRQEIHLQQAERLAKIRSIRKQAEVQNTLESVRQLASSNQNTIPALIKAVRARATLGEMIDALSSVYGHHHITAGRV